MRTTALPDYARMRRDAGPGDVQVIGVRPGSGSLTVTFDTGRVPEPILGPDGKPLVGTSAYDALLQVFPDGSYTEALPLARIALGRTYAPGDVRVRVAGFAGPDMVNVEPIVARAGRPLVLDVKRFRPAMAYAVPADPDGGGLAVATAV